MHAGVRADRRKDEFAVTLPPSADAAGGVSAARQATGHGNRPAANPSCWHQARLLGDLETYVSRQSDIIIDYAAARRCEEPISTAITERVEDGLHATRAA
jgi:hypothetical protein